jgi:hypothetical protein
MIQPLHDKCDLGTAGRRDFNLLRSMGIALQPFEGKLLLMCTSNMRRSAHDGGTQHHGRHTAIITTQFW